VAFFIEVGLLLIVLPWSTFWETNYFASMYPNLLPLMTNDFVRGGVSGVGLINLCAGVAELAGVFVLRPDIRRELPQTSYPDSVDRRAEP
jgi:hypothetical protein